jgi:8-oxo-dGTP diphosphatase
MSAEVPRVGVGVFVLNSEGRFIMGMRKGSLGSGTIALPGGHLDFGESFEDCAAREVMEETGLDVKNIHFLTAVNSVMEEEQKHYITVFMVAEASSDQKPQLMEPDKCKEWFWVSWEKMKNWANSGLSERAGRPDENSKSSLVPNGTYPKLFLPLLNLVRDRPEAIPRLLEN